MDNNGINNNQDWSNAIGDMMREAKVSAPANGWERLESVLPAAAPRPRPLIWRVASIAAVLLVGLIGASLWFMDDIVDSAVPKKDILAQVETVIEDNEEVLEQEIEDVVTPAEPTFVAQRKTISEPKEVVEVVEHSDDSAPEFVADEAEDKPEVKASAAPHRNEPNTYATIESSRERTFERKKPKKSTRIALAMNRGMGNSNTGLDSHNMEYDARPASPGITSMVLDPDGYDPSIDKNYKNSEKIHSIPLGFALSVGYDLNERLSLESGLSYTYLHSTIKMPLNSESLDQDIHMAGVPLRLNYRFFTRKAFNAYVSGGVLAERVVYAKLGDLRVKERGWQFGYGAALGAQYNITPLLGLYVEPDLSYYSYNTHLESVRTESPLNFSFRVGLRFNL